MTILHFNLSLSITFIFKRFMPGLNYWYFFFRFVWCNFISLRSFSSFLWYFSLNSSRFFISLLSSSFLYDYLTTLRCWFNNNLLSSFFRSNVLFLWFLNWKRSNFLYSWISLEFFLLNISWWCLTLFYITCWFFNITIKLSFGSLLFINASLS